MEDIKYKFEEVRGKTEIGFDLINKRWFLRRAGPTGNFLGLNLIEDNNIELENVPLDTHQWTDLQDPFKTHGRFMYYDGCLTEIKGDSVIANSAKIKGNQKKLSFIEINAKEIEFLYNRKKMTWAIIADGNRYETNNIVGIFNKIQFTGSKKDEEIRAFVKDKKFMYSWLVTIFESNLELS